MRLALLREESWRSRFGSARDIHRLRLSDSRGPIQIIGVLPAGFIVPSVNWAAPSDGLLLTDDLIETAAPNDGIPGVFARLRPGASTALAQEQFDALFAPLQRDRPSLSDTQVRVKSMQQGIFWNVQIPLTILFIGGLLVWLVACANLGSLMAARAQSREHLTAIRSSLGASKGRILFLVILECAVLCAFGTALAMLFMIWTIEGLTALIPSFYQPLVLTGIDSRMIGFVLIAGTLGSVLAGAYPAWLAVRASACGGLQRAGISARQHRRGRRTLLIVESAMGTALILAGSLAIRSFVGLINTDLGFAPEGLYGATVGPSPGVASQTATDASAVQRDARVVQLRRVLGILREYPQVAAVSAADVAPGSGEAAQLLTDSEGRQVVRRRILEDYFQVMGTSFLAGRSFTEAEVQAAAPVAIMSVSAVRLMWPDVEGPRALGRTVVFEGEAPRELVGIVANTRERHAQPFRPELFTPPGADGEVPQTYLWRTTDFGGVDVEVLRSALRREYGPTTRLTFVSIAGQLEPWLQDPRLYAAVFGGFGAVALLLSAIGLFAVVSFDVSMRRYEMGVRMALGASSGDIELLLMRDAAFPVSVGLAIGYLGSFWAARVFQSLLHEVDARDVTMYLFVALVLLGTSVLSVWRPARLAGRIDTLAALRTQ